MSEYWDNLITGTKKGYKKYDIMDISEDGLKITEKFGNICAAGS